MTADFNRGRLTLAILAPAVFVAVTAILMSLVVLYVLAPEGTGADAGLARIGDNLALVIVTGSGVPVAQLRSAITIWGLIVPVVVIVIAGVVAWRISGRVQEKLEESERAVIAADEERNRRLQEVIHELRTPLAVMGTNLELAGDGVDESAARYVDAAHRAVSRMARTVDDLAGHGALAVETGDTPTDLGELAESTALEHVGPGQSRGVRIALQSEEKVILDRVDPAAVRTVVGNLLSNAIRLAPAGSKVTVDWGTLDDWAWLSVTDQGPGLAPHHHARAFERGWQGDHDRDRHEGSGLGLTIARQLTEAQGGMVTLASEEGGGATFTMWLPLDVEAEMTLVVDADLVHPRVEPWMRSAVTA